MKRRMTLAGLLLILPVTAFAGGDTRLAGNMPLVTPGIGQPMPKGFAPAPVPNPDILAPRLTRAPVPGEPGFAAALTPIGQTVRYDQGHGPGSSFSEELQRRSRSGFGARYAPGFALTVPLDK